MNDLKRQLLKRSVKVQTLAAFLDIDRPYLSLILNGKRSAGRELATRLATAANMFTMRIGYYMPSDFTDHINIDDHYDLAIAELENIVAKAILTLDTFRHNADPNARPILQDFAQIKRLDDLVTKIKEVKS